VRQFGIGQGQEGERLGLGVSGDDKRRAGATESDPDPFAGQRTSQGDQAQTSRGRVGLEAETNDEAISVEDGRLGASSPRLVDSVERRTEGLAIDGDDMAVGVNSRGGQSAGVGGWLQVSGIAKSWANIVCERRPGPWPPYGPPLRSRDGTHTGRPRSSEAYVWRPGSRLRPW